jgi:hypothetical protein
MPVLAKYSSRVSAVGPRPCLIISITLKRKRVSVYKYLIAIYKNLFICSNAMLRKNALFIISNQILIIYNILSGGDYLW